MQFFLVQNPFFQKKRRKPSVQVRKKPMISGREKHPEDDKTRKLRTEYGNIQNITTTNTRNFDTVKIRNYHFQGIKSLKNPGFRDTMSNA